MMMNGCSVMQNGFQVANGNERCILFLFKGWNVNSQVKYGFMIVGVFCMGLLNAALAYLRQHLHSRYRDHSSLLINQLCLTVVYGIQIVLAYWMMLLVMTYEVGTFISLISGLVIGYFIFGYIQGRIRLLKDKRTISTDLIYENQFNSTPCCQTTT